MKKITLLLALLISSIGFSQDLLIGFETGESGGLLGDPFGGMAKPTVVTGTGSNTSQVLQVVGNSATEVWQGTNFTLSQIVDLTNTQTMTIDVKSSTAITFLVKVNGGLNGAPEAAAEVTHNGDGTWQTLSFTFNSAKDNKAAAANGQYNNFVLHAYWAENATVFGDVTKDERTFMIDNISGPKVAANTVATLSDIKIDGTTVSGFSSATDTYAYRVVQGGSVPVVTATVTEASAIAVVTAATSIPGNTTILVTAGNGTSTKTYTVSFELDKAPTTAAPTPPARNAWDVVSLYSDAYTNTALNFDAGWCGNNSVETIQVAGDNIVAFKGNNCQGIVLDDAVDVTGFTHIHVDVYIDETVDVTSKVFNLKFVGVPSSIFVEYPFNAGSSPALVAGTWLSIDIPVNLSTMANFKEFGITADNLKNQVWYDNLYIYRAATASVENNELLGFSMYPNPATNKLNISAKETIQNADVFNVLGKKVMSVNVNDTKASIDVSNLSSGIYLVKYNVGNTTGTAKFIKQ
ncbi:hypothetical protein LPB03_00490 [Polaribacter vadi]|jgi:hypothetical protein|uniref:Secretion system C-terminal sorting domain-containing protein n=1 Tax=Polaribacter vadi TaxID=1774273 RepID=A0A1B8TZP4_9FLAO|nr:T9SS type A sorting domain-containing protein [Polaribacter vadi]AOW16026.1 hypothetical protein LPB03_00490 [Polaribacter vadi]OBY65065.1 hypothetical protein LPB3_04615 [Polaribacter vadi]